MADEKINCLKCKYYYISWDARMPYACRLFGFKGRQIPSISVLQSSGSPCQGFESKVKMSQNNR